jgi:hypothetical protein
MRDRMIALFESALESIAVWFGLAMTVVIGHALSHHVDIEDAVAIVFAGLLVLRAVRRRGDP